ncbi:BCL2-associated athanogene [Lecanosticta acicola]|uniref:BCL2-associated athanogene n=1 Tax=Lecanosticta acicola TaxID=111012 RepID=A0AAI8Z062_9PEZI|nr:BCL2-associated athanogene [Lecanosticta acicola]
MSWTSRLGNLGRFSPFTRSPPQGSTKVSDADFSYITADDLRRHQAESGNPQQDSSESYGDYDPPRETDSLTVRNKKQEYTVHFPAYSIAKGELTIGQLREQVAKKVGTSDARRIKLLYKGKNLKDDSRTCKQENLKHGVELMCTVADRAPSLSDSDSEDDLDGVDDTREGEPKRRRNRGKKTKRRNKREERDVPPSGSYGDPNLGVPSGSQQASRTQSPKPPPSPATPLDKLNAINAKLQSLIPDVRAFKTSPPSDPAKKEFEHKRLSETILTQVLLKLDAVESEGDVDARSRRKELVQETQKVLQDLDAAMKA